MEAAVECCWNPWHGCRKLSEGCRNCFVYRIDARHNRDSAEVRQNADFDLPVRRRRAGDYKIPSGALVYTCFTSDFFLDLADAWRPAAWEMMRRRADVDFLIITKRIDRLAVGLPADWGDGYPNVELCCTVENQDRAAYRLPIFADAAAARKSIICEPLLSPIDLSPYLGPWVRRVVVGGESGEQARPCDYDWVLSLRSQYIMANVPFFFKQTGARLRKDGRLYRIPRRFQHEQARRAAIDFIPGGQKNEV